MAFGFCHLDFEIKMFPKYTKITFFFFLVVTVVVSGFFVLKNNRIFTGSASSDDNFSGYAWSSNFGWISFNCTNEANCGSSDYGVDLDMEYGDFSGYAWSSNIGWIDFSPAGPYPGAPYHGAKYEYEDTGDVRRVTGWAKALTLGDEGWLKMHPDPWLSGWGQRRKITIDSSYIDQELSGFPIPVFLNGSAGDNSEDVTSVFNEIGSDVQKMAVTGPDARTQLYAEVEKWDASGREGVLWITGQDLDIASSSDTHLYLYYDNSQPVNDDHVTVGVNATTSAEIWGGEQVLAQHFNEEPDGSADGIRDSSPAENHGQSQGGMDSSDLIDGRMDGGLQFNGVNQYVEIPDSDSLSATGTVSVSLWIKRSGDGSGANPRILSKDTDETWGFLEDTGLVDGDNSLIWRINVGGTLITMDDSVAIPNQWTGYTGSFDGGVVSLRRNGQLVATTSAVGDIGTNSKTLQIGGDSRAGAYWNGLVDEVRIATTTRSSSYLNAAYQGGEDRLLNWGAEESNNYGVTANIMTGDFSGWAWNKSRVNNASGIGWISFNCADSGAGGCTDTDYSIHAFLNTAPDSIDMTAPNWNYSNACSQGARNAFLNWDVDDPDKGAAQEAYRLIVDDSADISAPNVFDTGRVEGGAKQYHLSSPVLDYGKSYSWWVKVWDNHEVDSSLNQYDTEPDTDNDDGQIHTFTVYEHEFPNPGFYYMPTSPSINEDVKFVSSSTRYTIAEPATATSCIDSACNYNWSIPSEDVILKKGDPNASSTIILEFTSTSTYSIGLEVTDTEEYICGTSTFIEMKPSLPTWREVKVD